MISRIIKILFITALAGAICLSGYNLIVISRQYAEEARVKAEMAKYRLDGAERQEAADNQFIIHLQEEVNSDLVGWLTIAQTQIDYPFVRGEDNDFYLQRNVYKEYAAAGSLFLDFRCAADFSGGNTIIYGHNMKNKSMFGDLDLFAEEEFFEANEGGWIYLKDKAISLEIFAYMVIHMDDEMIYNLEPEQGQFMDYIRKKAQNFREPPDPPQNFVTLSTCSYQFNDARTVLLAYTTP